MNLGYTGWVLAWYFVHFLVMYLQCTGPGHHPLPPVSPPPPTTPPSNLDEFNHPNSPVPEGQVTGFGCDVGGRRPSSIGECGSYSNSGGS